MSRAKPSPELEQGRRAAVRDLLAGLGLLGLGALVGGTSLTGRGDGVDVAFDLLAGAWIGWGLFRLRRPRPA